MQTAVVLSLKEMVPAAGSDPSHMSVTSWVSIQLIRTFEVHL